MVNAMFQELRQLAALDRVNIVAAGNRMMDDLCERRKPIEFADDPVDGCLRVGEKEISVFAFQVRPLPLRGDPFLSDRRRRRKKRYRRCANARISSLRRPARILAPMENKPGIQTIHIEAYCACTSAERHHQPQCIHSQ